MFKSVWMPVEEAMMLLGIEVFLAAARAGAIECRGNKSLFEHDWSSIPARDWWHGSVPMIDGRRVAGMSWGFGATASARWLDSEARRADVEALPLDAGHSGNPGPKKALKGPEPGTTNKVTQERRKLFPKIDERLKNGARSVTRAVKMLPESELPGDGGTSESRRSALVRQYKKEHRTP